MPELALNKSQSVDDSRSSQHALEYGPICGRRVSGKDVEGGLRNIDVGDAGKS